MTTDKEKIKLLEKIQKKYQKELDAVIAEKKYLEQKIAALGVVVETITKDIAELE